MTTDYLADQFKKLVSEVLSSDSLRMDIVESQIEKHGITLSEPQLQALREHIASRGDIFLLELSDAQNAQILEKHEGIQDFNIDFSDFDFPDSKADELTEVLLNIFLERISDAMAKEWLSKAELLIELEHDEQKGFVKEIERTWGHALRILEALVNICQDEGAKINDELRQNTEFSQKNLSLIEAVTRLHARGCQVASEIVLLLRHGFADGAHARWRTLHEITTIANFISIHGDQVARKYLDHSVVMAYEQLKSYNDTYKAIGYSAPDPKEADRLAQEFDQLLHKYGKNFKLPYGWAAHILPGPSFKKIEGAAQFAHMRAFYVLANMNVHADSRSVFYRLSMFPDDSSTLPTGSSTFGLGEPLQNAAYSINNLTGTLLLLQPNIDHLAFVTATTKLTSEMVRAVDHIIHPEENEPSN